MRVNSRDLGRIVAQLEKAFDEKDRVRETSLRTARSIARLASDAIRGMHREENVEKGLTALHEEVVALGKSLRNHPEFWTGGAVEGALQEAAEAAIVYAILHRRPLPSPDDLGVTEAAYALGLGDSIGELRRVALDRMRLGKLEDAERMVDTMDDIFHALLRIRYPDAIVAIRHKQDVARGILERTRGELAVAARTAELERKMAGLSRRR